MENQQGYNEEFEIQKRIAFTAGLLQGDVTIKTLLESLAEGVIFINESGQIILINKRMSEMTGYERQEVTGQQIDVFIPADLREKHRRHLKDFFLKPKIRSMGIGMELTARRKDDSTFPVEVSISYLTTESGMLGIGFVTDITDRKKAEKELKDRNIALDEYAHTVAHDLKASLSGIIGYAELLIDRKDDLPEEKQESYLKQVALSGRKMNNIIKDMLLFASLKKEDVDIEEVDMRKSIESACQRLKFQMEEKKAQLIIKEPVLNCMGYTTWIEEVWYNFISNAVKYGGEIPRVELECTKDQKGFIKYSVIDNGPGLTESFKSVIFHDKDIEKDKLTKGLGLGLSIVRRIVEKLDGFVGVESEQGKGSKFSFSLPCPA